MKPALSAITSPSASSALNSASSAPSSASSALSSASSERVILVELPTHLCRLAGAPHVVSLAVPGSVSQRGVLDALEARYPMLQGTLRDAGTQVRRPFIRFFACEQDLSHQPPDEPLPAAVAEGREPFLILGAIAGG